MTVAEVVRLPVVQRGQPEVLSRRRFDQPIRWVHGSDLSDLSSLLQGGELVLTTGAALARATRKYLRGLADAGAVGVIVEVGTVVPAVPESAGRIAEELDIALVVLHRTVRFVEVTESVHRILVAEQYEEVAFDRRVHKTFTDLSLKRASLAGIVDAAARMLGEPVVLEDLSHHVLAVSAGTPAEVLSDWERRSRRTPGPGAEPWALTGVGPQSQQWGRLLVPRQPADETRAHLVLERAAAALTMHRMIEQDRTGLQYQAQSGLIDDVLRGRITGEPYVAARAHALGLRAASQYVPAVVRVPRPASTGDPVAARRNDITLLDAVAHCVNAAGHSGLFTLRGDGEVAAVLALKDSRPSAAAKALAALGNRLHLEILRVDASPDSVLAVGPSAESVAGSIAGLSEATEVAEAALTMAGSRLYYRASDIRLRGLVSLLRADRRVQRFAETELKALLSDDDGADPTNMTVLREYLRLAGNKAALAERLHISRPALYKRLAAIRNALGVDLDDGESMTSLHVAVMILDSINAVSGRR